MSWTKAVAAASLSAVLFMGCTEREAETRGERAEQATERAGERTEGALERAGEGAAEAGREVAGGVREAGREIAGTVERVTEDGIDLGDRDIRIGEDTEFFRDGERIEREDIRPGDEVRAAFDEAGDELEAKRVEVRRKME